ncbi:MAG TPA: hypothetical protein DEV81_09730 [Cyanobacteria bacterium UBA11049]|nr:hypothetical protein [Cyanobacteria bacterium UBA11049]
MKNLTQFTTIVSLFSALIIIAPTTTQAQSTKPVLPKFPPNTILKVRHLRGNCPKTVGIWTSFRTYEGGGEHTVIADILPIANRAKVISYGQKLVDYKAALKKAYADCNGSAVDAGDGEDLYRFIFRDGNVFFRVVLPPDTDANPSIFSNISVLGGQPYLRWAIAD